MWTCVHIVYWRVIIKYTKSHSFCAQCAVFKGINPDIMRLFLNIILFLMTHMF